MKSFRLVFIFFLLRPGGSRSDTVGSGGPRFRLTPLCHLGYMWFYITGGEVKPLSQVPTCVVMRDVVCEGFQLLCLYGGVCVSSFVRGVCERG